MPRRDEVDPMFDGHLEKPLSEMTVDEKLDWIWEGMQLLWAGKQAREKATSGNGDEGDGSG
jgi:hypothetical protein